MLPLVIELANDVDLLAWAKHNREWIETELSKHGAMLFRRFGVNSVQAFENFATTICLSHSLTMEICRENR
jgi:hypothetical protein